MSKKNSVYRAVGLLGGPVNAARLIKGVKGYQTVQQWVSSGTVPAKYAPEIEVLTDRAVLCEEICPDVDWSVLRNS